MVQVVQKMSGLHHNNCRTGFSLIELIIVIALIGVMTMIVTPLLRTEDLAQERANFVNQLNSFVIGAQYNALVSGKINRVVFDFKKSQVYIELQIGQVDAQGQDQYEAVNVDFNENIFSWNSAHFKIKDFFVNQKNELLDGNSDQAWYYLMPDGNAQNVIINFYDLKDSEKYHESAEYSMVLNPFAAQFKLYELFQQPA